MVTIQRNTEVFIGQTNIECESALIGQHQKQSEGVFIGN